MAAVKPSDTEEPQLGKTLDFLRGIWWLDHALHARSKAMAKRTGLTGPQRLALRIIGTSPEISSGRLAKILHVHPSTLTGVLQRLESAGYITRTIDAADGRRALFSLTRAGEKFAAPIEFSVEGAVKKALKKFDAAEIDRAQVLIEQLAETLLDGTVAGEQNVD